MDLSLHGSQINLLARYKPKVPTIKYPQLHERPRSAITFHRPGSAQYKYQQRPQSADNKLAQSLENCIRFSEDILNEGKITRKINYSSISSSNLLKLLLEDPIKRSWLRQRDQSNRHHKRKQRSSSLDEISMDEEYNYRQFNEDKHRKPYSKSMFSSNSSMRVSTAPPRTNPPNQLQSRFKNLRKSQEPLLGTVGSMIKSRSAPALNKKELSLYDTKQDVPGRFSFSKKSNSTTTKIFNDNDSDSSYNMETTDGHIKERPSTSSAGSNKKSVRFGENVQVHAEIYQYPNCSPESCSCIGHSSTPTSSNQDSIKNCLCDSYTTSKNYPNFSENSIKPIQMHNFEDEENAIITNYKNVLKSDLYPTTATTTSSATATTATTSTYFEPDIFVVEDYKKTIDDHERKFQLDLKLNDSSTSSNYSSNIFINNFNQHNDILSSEDNLTATNSKYDTIHYQPNNFTDNRIFQQNSISQQKNFANNHENSSVINNYLEATATPIKPPQKTLNNVSITKDSSSLITKNISQRSKSTMTPSKNKENPKKISNKKLVKKSPNFFKTSDDSILNEFNLDNIDSWISLQNDSEDSTKQQRNERYKNFQRFTKLNRSHTPETELSETSKSPETEDSQDDSTYDEIVSVIKEIEEEKKHGELTARNKESEIEFKLQTSSTTDSPHTNSTITTGTKTPSENESNDKLHDILNYLEDVEDSCNRTLLETRRSMPDTNRTEVDFSVEPDIAEDVPKLADLLMLPNHQLARRVISLSLRANELSNAVHLAKEHVVQIRVEKQKSIRTEKLNSENRSRDQKKYFEKVITRHQDFIEQLLKDKGSLCDRVAALTRRLDSQNQAWEHKLETEISRIKDTTLAGEKVRRERWVRENTKKIKDLTVKGVETEINKINLNHQQEITNLKRNHQQEILDAVDETRQKYEQIENAIRESCAKDRELLIQKERNAIRERFEKQLTEERKLFEDQKNNLIDDNTGERERLQLEIRERDERFAREKQDIQREHELAMEKLYSESQSKLEQQEKKYEIRINSMEKQFESDLLIWKREFENTCKLREVEKENIIRQNYRTERDRQIDAIVSRIDNETQKAQEEFEIKISRLKEKHEKDISDAETTERLIREKYNDTRNRLAESEALVQNHQAEIKQLQIELEHSKKMCNEFLIEKEKLKEISRNDVKMELASLKTERDNEIEKIYKRVQQAIEKKDTTIELLQKESGTLRERCIKLEAVIRQQRKDYCIK